MALSPYSVFMGLPVSYWGITVHVLYLIMAGLALVDSRRDRPGGVRGWAVLIVMAAAGIASSSVLLYISHYLIRSLCPFCMVIYVLNLLITITLTFHLVRRHRDIGSMFRTDVRGFIPRPALAAFAVPIVMIVAGYVIYPRIYDTGSCPETASGKLCTAPSTYGNPDARIKIVEYSDYECPFCGMTHFALRKAVETYPEDVVLIHVNFPLDMACNDLLPRPFHDNACDAARATVCAQRQGRFWDYNDYLFTHQKQIGRVPYERIASGLGLDVDAFERCMTDPTSLDEVEADIQKAKQTTFVQQGQVGTPIIFIGDKGHMGAIHWEDLQRELQQRYGLEPHSEETGP
ncbi:MAG: thioredoxin domain-containing protein [Deltaproteobacteria bacterium]|nr:thioredoxin domain-containing protein [Deltaproteobacteria bacterium]